MCIQVIYILSRLYFEIYMYIQIHIMHVKQLINKRGRGLEKSKEGYSGGFGRRKVKGWMMCLYYNLKNIVRYIKKWNRAKEKQRQREKLIRSQCVPEWISVFFPQTQKLHFWPRKNFRKATQQTNILIFNSHNCHEQRHFWKPWRVTSQMNNPFFISYKLWTTTKTIVTKIHFLEWNWF